MRQQEQIAQGEKLLRYVAEGTTALADAVYANDVSDYICPKQAAAEREQFFRKGPINVGLSCLLPNAGDYLTHDHSGVPILLVRQHDGSLGAFMNVCRHRGSRVAEGCGNAKLFTCPYHAWTYDASGRLRGRPDENSFAGYAKDTAGLRPLPVMEKQGLIWVSPTPGADFDIGRTLGGLEDELASYKLDTYHHYETRELTQRTNWKLVIDTFLELYHLQYLHQKTVAPIIHSNVATFDAYGHCLRMIGARRTIDRLNATPREQWNILPVTVMVYVLFPNTAFVMQGDHVETWHSYPAGDGINEAVMRVSLYTPEPATSEKAKRYWDRNFDLLMATVKEEDFPLAEGIQRGFHSGAQEAIHFGRNEPALQHFHKSVKAALALGI